MGSPTSRAEKSPPAADRPAEGNHPWDNGIAHEALQERQRGGKFTEGPGKRPQAALT